MMFRYQPITLLGRVEKRTKDSKDSAWESIFQTNVDLYFTTRKLSFWNISEYLGRSGIQMHQSVTERSRQSGKKTQLCMWELLSRMIRAGEQSEQESDYDGKIALAI